MKVILKNDGIARTYKCENWYDAIILFDVLTRGIYRGGRVELWDGKTLKREYSFTCQQKTRTKVVLNELKREYSI